MFLTFNVRQYWNMLRFVWAHRAWRGRRKMLFRLLVLVPLVYLVHSVFFFLDKLVFPGLWSQKIEKPIFIIGHARSGTTLLHRLMAADEGRFNYFRYWEMFFPSLIEKKLIRALGVVDRVLLNSFWYRGLQAWDDKTFGPMRHVHNMGLWIPEEDDFVMNVTFFAAYWQLQVPLMDRNDIFHLDERPAPFRRRVMNTYKECVRRQLYLYGGDRIHLSKNPFYSGRVGSLLEAFPDARFVVNMRDPMECIPSIAKVMEDNYSSKGWQPDEYQTTLAELERVSYDTFRLPRQVLAERPDVPQCVVDYRDLVSDAHWTVSAVYEALKMPMSDAYREHLEERSARNKKHETRHKYDAAEFNMNLDRMKNELPDFYEEYRWDESTTTGSSS